MFCRYTIQAFNGCSETVSDAQNDALQWIIDKAVTRHETDIDITERLLLLNLAASHTSSSVRPVFGCQLLIRQLTTPFTVA